MILSGDGVIALEFQMRFVEKTAVGFAGIALAGLLAGCHGGGLGNHGLEMDRLQNRYEELGQLVAHAQHCSLPVDDNQVHDWLKAYAGKNGADPTETTSLVSYYDAAVQNEGRSISSTPCNDDEKTRTAALLNDKLNQFK